MTAVPLGPGPEFDRIRAVARALGDSAAGLGDDCAFLELGSTTLCLSVDTSVENIHFRRDWMTPWEIGWRAAAAALSDLAAVGAQVEGVLACVSLPRTEPEATTVEVMRGVAAVTATVGGRVLGGDLSAGAELSVGITVVGRAERPIRRVGARPGDGVWVTGTLGGARAALDAWRSGSRPDPGARESFAQPRPRIAVGQWLAARGATAMIDLSDGLAGDAQHLARASNVGLVIELDRVPIHPSVPNGTEPRAVFAARGGEDYELLVTLPPEFEPSGSPEVPLTRIGSVVSGERTQFRMGRDVVTLAGFDHFA